MKKARLTLHRKEDSEAKCICGSKMKYVDGSGFVCPVQYRNKEPNVIDVLI